MSIVALKYSQNWWDIARRLKEERGNQCEACYIRHDADPHNILTVHHIDYNTQNNDPSNLIVLCQRCHLGRHGIENRSRKADLERQRLISIGQRFLPGF